MRTALVALGVIAMFDAAPAGAQPAQMAPGGAAARCGVQLVRAPDAVKTLVEARLAREPQCGTQLVVRIVPTTGGLYLLAQTQSGHVYEMVVPDAETATELIATWAQRREAAAGGTYAAPAAPAPYAATAGSPYAATAAAPYAPPSAAAGGPYAALASREEVADSYAVPRIGPPGITPEIRPGETRRPEGGHWIAVAGMISPDVRGLRGELDLWAKGRWTVGAALAYTGMQMGNAGEATQLDFRDLRGVASLAYTAGQGALRFRGQVSAGVVRTELTWAMGGFAPLEHAGVTPIGEANAHLHLLLGRDRAWALTGGPTLTMYGQKFQIQDGAAAHRTLDVSFVGGMRRRL